LSLLRYYVITVTLGYYAYYAITLLRYYGDACTIPLSAAILSVWEFMYVGVPLISKRK